MGVWYDIGGSMKVKDNEATRKLLVKLEDNLSTDIEVGVDEHGDGTMTVEINGGQECSYSTVEEAEKTLYEFAEHIVGEVGHFWTKLDEDDGEVYVGNEEACEKAIRLAVVDEARQAIKKLTVEEWEELHEEVTSPHFWIGK